ncbi:MULTISPECIES: ABC transporter ATP-binding protein [Herbaspirillum]|jgi:branched-chain amino acid transport system ATP-binding protein|uniref:ABC transporter ATP-binding protein n=1 Tax=Herbaspirillum TaxID=963 RepID=UPI00258DC270|nr:MULTISPECIES: ABC transporter ATP-binding protein [Herbaspirillum]MCP3655257.1 ABC transporter ATP-binding protein [Herbaspirillum sp.]MCP3945564.1 ABC transporter ATP-binding protein [Herbaspirillum sp.]MCP4031880.1 ABC transporter ATP-binding protein [Herbaspirillum sp.]MCP4558689.1 ABC transporter ATP-binding protein [Herbaspirillum sp.]MEE1635649.1 ABC transporter ATP-binding protein [Herbaspirillum huttiense NC40101]
MDKSSALLRITGLQAWYGQSHVLHGVSLEVARGEIVSILGRNGAGRSTLLKAVMGQVRSTGEIDFEDRSLAGLATYAIAQRGVGYVPESRDVFPALTVQQNLLLGRKSGPVPDDGWREEEVLTLFPSLERRYKVAAGALSGGEQQMLALGRALMGNPRLLLIDEPTEGLSPQMVGQVAHYLELLRQRQVAVLLIEQKQALALELSQRVYVMGRGEMVFHGTPAQLAADQALQQEWLAL